MVILLVDDLFCGYEIVGALPAIFSVMEKSASGRRRLLPL
jgi:hypothetical protein